jgi:serine phosphatase RsbU (regulator of sigma subunit)
LNETLTLAFFSENPEPSTKDESEKKSETLHIDNGSTEDSRLKILTHLVSKVTKELERKNEELNHNNNILREYSKLIDERNLEIGKSLRYASKLQNSIVFQEDEFDNVFEDHFIFFEPKEQVSGDFYFIRDLGDKIVLAVADGTGHGVPGAFISILGVQVMHSITRRMKNGREDLNAAEFLNLLREKMKRILDRNRISKFSTDGLDISLIIIDKVSREVDFSGANQCMIIYSGNELIQLKGDRMPIGAFVQEDSFSNTSLILEEDSKVFMYTDGFADQFGGKDAKKINSHKLRSLIRKNADRPLTEIKKEFKNYFETWKGDFEQTDDVLLLGFKL